jgi:hypothetical protein
MDIQPRLLLCVLLLLLLLRLFASLSPCMSRILMKAA